MRRRAIWLVLCIAVGASIITQDVGAQIMDDQIYSLVLLDQLEYRRAGESNPIGWELLGWVGGDFTRLWLKSEGEQATEGGGGDFELQVLYGRLIAPYWDVQVGARLDVTHGGGSNAVRALAVASLEGLAPYRFELEPAVFVSHEGDLSARLTASYDMFVTQRLIVQPRFEINAAVQDVPEFGIGSGLNDVDLGLRVRFSVQRELAPYVGVSWTRQFAATADLARLDGDDVSDLALVGGIRMWF